MAKARRSHVGTLTRSTVRRTMRTSFRSAAHRSLIVTQSVLALALCMTHFVKICSLPFAAVVRGATGSVSLYRSIAVSGRVCWQLKCNPTIPSVLDHYTTRLHSFLNAARAVRSLGAPALALAYVSCGWLDAFCEDNISPWDTLAGTLLVEEAGGRATDFTADIARPIDDRSIFSPPTDTCTKISSIS